MWGGGGGRGRGGGEVVPHAATLLGVTVTVLDAMLLDCVLRVARRRQWRLIRAGKVDLSSYSD